MKPLSKGNKVLILLILSFLMFNMTGTSCQKELNNSPDKKQRYIDTVFDNITIQRNIVFGTSVNEKGVSENLKLDIYSPEEDIIQNRPVIVWIHGGGFRPGNDKTQSYIVEMANRFARKGYVCLSIDYRLRDNPKEDPAVTISD
ncbi:MAG: alpha/beta hydrolase, partial [Bacteroidales bacterium]|nr:alpha/beta hydrolase [Bacteroidales bacterium]